MIVQARNRNQPRVPSLSGAGSLRPGANGACVSQGAWAALS